MSTSFIWCVTHEWWLVVSMFLSGLYCDIDSAFYEGRLGKWTPICKQQS